MKKHWVVLLVVALAAFMVFSTAQAQKKGGTLTIGRPTDPVALDPALETTAPGAWVYFNILEPLLVLDHNMNITYKLATDHKVLSSQKVRFTLRKNVKFHDGTPFNAEAVKFTFEKAYKSQPQARWASLAGPIDRVDVIDDYTVDIITKEPYGPILRSMAMSYTGILSPAAVKKMGQDFPRNPVGTGPFKFKEWKTNDRITLVRNDDYWGPKAYLDQVVFRVIPEEGARTLALKTGEVDFIIHVAPAEIANFEKDKAFTVHKASGLQVLQVGFNCEKPPVDDPKVRQALSCAVNVDYIIKHILEGSATRAKSYISPGVLGYKDMGLEKLYPYDKAKAVALLAEAGWKPGPDKIMRKGDQKLTLSYLAPRGRYMKDAEVTEAVQAMFKEIGVEANVQFGEWGSVFSQLRSAKFDHHMFTFAWITTNADGDYSLYNLFHSKGAPPASWNTYRYANPKVDKLVEEARDSLDTKKREKLYGDVQDLLAKDMPLIPIYNSNMIYVSRNYVKGFKAHSVEYNLGFAETWLDK
jgi:peptide/nickel transport system substrate-binding protein